MKWSVGDMVDKKLNTKQLSMKQHITAAKKAISILGCDNESVASRPRKVIIYFYLALVRLHLEYCDRFLSAPEKKDIEIQEWVQQRATKMVTKLQHTT